MNTREFLQEAAITIPVAFAVTAVITYAYSLLVHGQGRVNWETAFQLGFILGIVLPLTRSPRKT